MTFLMRLGLNALALLIVAWLFKDIQATPLAAIFAALILGIVNATLKPVVKLLTLPLNFLTLGLLGLVINALFFKLVDLLVYGFEIHGFFAALFGSIVLTFVSWLLNQFVED